jgi:hypothetical protein
MKPKYTKIPFEDWKKDKPNWHDAIIGQTILYYDANNVYPDGSRAFAQGQIVDIIIEPGNKIYNIMFTEYKKWHRIGDTDIKYILQENTQPLPNKKNENELWEKFLKEKAENTEPYRPRPHNPWQPPYGYPYCMPWSISYQPLSRPEDQIFR